MASETVENYLKALHTLCEESPTGEAGLAKLATLLGVTKGTATSMVKRLVAMKLAKAQRYGGITLTASGKAAALDVLRRHRLIETFLVHTLGFDWSEVHAEAERLEHAVSPRLLDRLDVFLGRPTADPHGDPIPDAKGRIPGGNSTRTPARPLSECAKGSRVRIARIRNQSESFLKLLDAHKIRPGTIVTVTTIDPVAGTLELSTTPASARTKPLVLSTASAEGIAVEG
ncbi:MAG: metal-dependent transcriptional regulator [Planctomycetes bacterium]|nr:metal-dependent transcriptional regulator [Planctomycetota bacterium]